MKLYSKLYTLSFPIIHLLMVLVVSTISSTWNCAVGSTSPQCSSENQRTKSRPLSIVFTDKLPEIYDVPLVWNGEIARDVRGISGTHAASMFLAEGLAARGHFVQYVSDSVNSAEYKGVKYIPASVVSRIDCDIFVTTYNLSDFSLLSRIPFTTKKILIQRRSRWCI